MNSRFLQRTFQSAFAVLAVAAWAIQPSQALAQTITNTASYVTYQKITLASIIAVPTTVGSTPPAGYAAEFEPNSPLIVTYQQVKDGWGIKYLQIVLKNPSTTTSHGYALHAGNRPIATGDVLRLKSDLFVDAAPVTAMINIGYHLVSGSEYNGQMDSEASTVDTSRRSVQSLDAEFVGGTKSASTGLLSNVADARLAVYNIMPGAEIKLRVRTFDLSSGVTTGNGILPMLNMGQVSTVAPSQTAKVSIDLIRKTTTGNFQSAVELVNSSNTVVYSGPAHSSSSHWSATSGRVTDGFTIPIPAGLAAGTYKVRYRVMPTGSSGAVQLGRANTSVVERKIGTNDYRYEVGTIKVDPKAGVHVGMSFHRYPGTSEALLGPIAVTYKFARTTANDLTVLPWWDVDATGALDTTSNNPGWAKLDQWANKFSPNGEKSLLLTFFGSPTNASSSPKDVSSGFGTAAPGLRAPPKDLKVLKEAVTYSVNHLKGRVFAVECWNEPNAKDFFSGTTTQLADICKAVYEGARAADVTVPVICPQADGPETVGFVYGAKTTGGKPITDYCDWVGSHVYSRLGNDEWNKPYAVQSLNQSLRLLKKRGQDYGVSTKPVVITEYGNNRCRWNLYPAYGRVLPEQTLDTLSSWDRGQAIKSALLTAQEEGIKAVALYSYDHGLGDEDFAQCVRGGSYVWTTELDESGKQIINETVVNAINQTRLLIDSSTPSSR